MKILIIILLICLVVGIIFGVDAYNKNKYCNPILVAENFATSYLMEDPDGMKKWSYEDTHKRINDLNYIPIGGTYWWDSGGFQLLAWFRLGETIVATYGYYDSQFKGEFSDILLYTVVLQTRDKPSLWEKLRDFIRRASSLHKTRWLVVDLFSNSHILEYVDKLEKHLQERPDDFSKPSDEDVKDWGQKIWRQVQKEIEFETKWSTSQKIRQHTELDTLYKRYLLYLKHTREKR